MITMRVDDQDLDSLVFVNRVDRTMGPRVYNRVVKVELTIIDDVLKTIDVLNRIMTGELQRFYFSDQPDRYWKGRILEEIKPSNSWHLSEIELEIEVPDGVSYAIEPKEIVKEKATSIMIQNDGTETIYPQFEMMMNDDTHMIGVVNNNAAFQYGESLEASPLKETEVTETETTGGQWQRRKHELVIDNLNDMKKFKSFDINSIAPNWKSSGSFSQGQGASKTPTNGKITISKKATHWQTRQKMDNWVKGRTFPVKQSKKVNQSHSKKAYLLMNRGQYLGWLLEQDIDGSSSAQAGSIVPNYGSAGAYDWHGPAMKYTFGTQPTDFSVSMYHFFKIAKASEMGAVYMSVRNGEDEIASILFSAHTSDVNTHIYFSANNKGMEIYGNYNKQLVSDYYGRIGIDKKGDKISFQVRNDRKKKQFTRSYRVPDLEDVHADNVVIWCGQYGNFAKPSDNRPEYVHVLGLNSNVYVKPKSTTTTTLMNLPDPKYTWHKDEMLLIDMQDNSTLLNGTEELTPIAYGSQSVGVPPGEYEIGIVSSGDVPPDVTVRFRECYR